MTSVYLFPSEKLLRFSLFFTVGNLCTFALWSMISWTLHFRDNEEERFSKCFIKWHCSGGSIQRVSLWFGKNRTKIARNATDRRRIFQPLKIIFYKGIVIRRIESTTTNMAVRVHVNLYEQKRLKFLSKDAYNHTYKNHVSASKGASKDSLLCFS